jgi:hypothetical protein
MMRIDDASFDKLLTVALYRAAELDYGDIPSDDELDLTIEPSQRFQRKMRDLLRNPNRHIRSQRRPLYLKVMRYAAAIFIAFTLLLGTAMAASPTVRAAVVNFVRTWFEDRTEYQIPGSELHREWAFGYIPDGFELIEEARNELQQFYVYQNTNSTNIFITISSGRQSVDNEHSDFYQMTINGNAVDVYESNDPQYHSIIVMHDEMYGVFITLNSEIDISELIKIAENIE